MANPEVPPQTGIYYVEFVTDRGEDPAAQEYIDRLREECDTAGATLLVGLPPGPIDIARPPSNTAEARQARVKAADAVLRLFDEELPTYIKRVLANSAQRTGKPAAILVASEADRSPIIARRWSNIFGIQTMTPEGLSLAVARAVDARKAHQAARATERIIARVLDDAHLKSSD